MPEDVSEGAGRAALITTGEDGALALRVTRCARDGLVAFPPERYGCRRCGAHGDELRAGAVSARGVLADAVTVRRHRGPGPEVPFDIGSIRLDGGPVIRALVESGVAVGEAVHGVAVRDGDGGEWVRFEREGGAA